MNLSFARRVRPYAITQVADVIVPSVFTPYVQQITEEKARLVQSGVVERSALIDALLAGGGLTFNVPSFKDLANDADNVSSDVAAGVSDATPKKTGTAREIAVRLSRNSVWSSADLAGDLAGADPMQSIANRVGYYWARRLQAAFVATLTGVFNDNEAAPTGTEHVQNDLSVDISGGAFIDGVTNFSAEAFIDALATMGDSSDRLRAIMVHSVVMARMRKNNLIDMIPDARGEIEIPTFQGREVIEDDGLPVPSAGVYETWLFGMGAVKLGVGSPKVPTEVDRKPEAGAGGGEERLFSRVEWSLHPAGHQFAVASPAIGGPSNAATAGNLAHADSWVRAFPERKQIHIARLITREF
ncbi:MAG TPA: hypothetical protein VFW95_05960 [Candidatus Limnocylindria bacterium]|nr:hypothetical protein [Candidatus Limnocylindria bacterium]